MLRMVQRCAPADIEQALAQEPAPERDPDPCEVLVRGELHAVLHAAIADLPERQRRVLNGLLKAGDDPDRGYAAVALALDMPIGSLGPTRGRALARLSRDPRVAALGHPAE
jgi:DNA-directed RNA polymerase specialized sigma24 family protein